MAVNSVANLGLSTLIAKCRLYINLALGKKTFGGALFKGYNAAEVFFDLLCGKTLTSVFLNRQHPSKSTEVLKLMDLEIYNSV